VLTHDTEEMFRFAFPDPLAGRHDVRVVPLTVTGWQCSSGYWPLAFAEKMIL
jgi:hypothetical protein